MGCWRDGASEVSSAGLGVAWVVVPGHCRCSARDGWFVVGLPLPSMKGGDCVYGVAVQNGGGDGSGVYGGDCGGGGAVLVLVFDTGNTDLRT